MANTTVEIWQARRPIIISPCPDGGLSPQFLIALAVAAAVLASLMPLYAGLPDRIERIIRTFPLYLIVGGYIPSALFGVPLYLLLRKRLPPTLANGAITGAVVTALPTLLLGLPTFMEEESYGERITVLHHHKTL